MKLIATRGLPASGKTTWAKEKEESGGNYIRISKDDVREIMIGDGKWTPKKEAMAIQGQRALALVAKKNMQNVIFDDTNLNPVTLGKVRAFARENEFTFELQDMHRDAMLTRGDVEHFMKRDLDRGEKVGVSVIYKMALQYFPEVFTDEKYVLCDIDGTVADIKHRLEHVRGEDKDWKSFFSEMDKDKIRYDVVETLREKSEGKEIIFVTARPEDHREVTVNWIENMINETGLENVLTLHGEPVVIMRSSGDKRQDTVVKQQMYDKFFSKQDISMVFDDRPSVIRMWRENNLLVEDVGRGLEF